MTTKTSKLKIVTMGIDRTSFVKFAGGAADSGQYAVLGSACVYKLKEP